MRNAAISLYALGALLSAWLCLSYFTANAHLPFTVGIANAASSFVPMLALMVLVVCAQAQSRRVIWNLPPLVLAAAVTLLFALVAHGFPERAALWSIAHLSIVALGAAFLLVVIWRSPYGPAAL